jgi:hypothetical protein
MLSSENITFSQTVEVKSATLLSTKSVLCTFENAAQIGKSGLVKFVYMFHNVYRMLNYTNRPHNMITLILFYCHATKEYVALLMIF